MTAIDQNVSLPVKSAHTGWTSAPVALVVPVATGKSSAPAR